MTEDKRIEARINRPLVIKYRVSSEKDSQKWDVTVLKNISNNGTQITSKSYLPEQALLELHIKFPLKPTEWVKLAGKVIWVKGLGSGYKTELAPYTYLIGVRFVNLKEEDKALIKECIDWFQYKEAAGKSSKSSKKAEK